MANDELWRPLYPFASHYLNVPGGRYHYLDEGQGDRPLLMVHGNPTWSFYWRGLVRAFRDRQRVVVPDHLGCGLSDKPQNYRYQLQDHVENLVRLIDDLDLREITLLGHDWGGAIGLGAAMQRPDRFRQFVMFNTGAFPPPFFPWRIRVCRTPVIGPLAMRGANLFSLAALRMAVTDRRALSPQVQAGLLAPYDSWDHRVAVWNFVRDIPVSPREATWQYLERIEASLARWADHRWLFIWGMQDWCFRPECLDRFLKHLPRAEVHRVMQAGHWVVEEATPQIVDWMTAFLFRSDASVAESRR